MSKSLRVAALLVLSVLTPLVLITLYLAVTHGRAAGNLAVHRTLTALIPCSCVPFALGLPFDVVARIIIAVLLALVLYVFTQDYAFWAACVLFGSCP